MSSLQPIAWNANDAQNQNQRVPSSHCDPTRREGASRRASRLGSRRGGASASLINSQARLPSSVSTSFAGPSRYLPLVEFHKALLNMQSTNMLTDETASNLIHHLSPDDIQPVTTLFQSKNSMEQFLQQLVQLQNHRGGSGGSGNATFSYELPLLEFQKMVLDELQFQEDAESQIAELIPRLGPEAYSEVNNVFLMRSDLSDFVNALTALTRPRGGSVFSYNELYTVAHNLLRSESNFDSRPIEAIQTSITHRMRGILVDWLLEVAQRFKCCQETLHLTCALVDRFLMVQRVQRSELQLVGVAAMLLASKYEEVYPPELRDFVFVAACTYPKEEVVRMERQIFVVLEYRVTLPTLNALANVQLYQQDPTATAMQKSVCGYILDTMLIAFYFGQFKSSLLVSAAVWMSRIWCKIPTQMDVSPDIAMLVPMVVTHLKEINSPSGRLAAVRVKYGQQCHSYVSATPIPTELDNFCARSSSAPQTQALVAPPQKMN